MTWDPSSTLNVPSGPGLSFTQRAASGIATRTQNYIWTAVASSGGTSVVVTATHSAAASIHGGVLYVCPTADGYSLAATPNTLVTTSAGSGALAGTAGSLGIFAVGDAGAVNGSTRAYLPVSSTDDLYTFSASDVTEYWAHCTLTGASTTVGLSSPSSTFFTTIGIEVLFSGGGGAAARTKAKVSNRATILRASTR
jgi:hypothetical protein